MKRHKHKKQKHRKQKIRKTEVVVSLLIILLGIMVITNQSNINEADTSPNATYSRYNLEIQCKASFMKCKSIATRKYNTLSIRIIKTQQFEDVKTATQFFNTWRTPAQTFITLGERKHFNNEESYPLVLIATNMKLETDLPIVAICNKDGELTDLTKLRFLC